MQCPDWISDKCSASSDAGIQSQSAVAAGSFLRASELAVGVLPLRPGRYGLDRVPVRPGQVQQWQPTNGFEADVLLIDPAVVQPTASTHRQATMSLLRLEEWRLAIAG